MSVYLIDYENVNESGLEGIKSLQADDMVYVFYSDKVKNMPFSRGIELAQSKARIEFIEIRKTAKNYLDFQLSTYLGFIIGRGEKSTFYVISGDKGFDSVIDFWKGRNITISRQEAISRKASQKAEQKKQQARAKAEQKNKRKAEAKKEGVSNAALAEVQEAAPQLKEEPLSAAEIPEAPAETAAVESVKPETVIPETAAPVAKETENEVQEAKAPDAEGQKSEESAAIPEAPAADDVKAEAEEKAAEPEKKEEKKEKRQAKPAIPESVKKKIRAAVKDDKLPPSNYTKIYKAIIECRDKQGLNNALVKSFSNEMGSRIYGRVKSIFEEYKMN